MEGLKFLNCKMMQQQKHWTEKKVKDLHKRKKIRGYHITPKSDNNISFNKLTKQDRRSAEKEWMEINLQWWCNNKAVSLLTEYLFDQPSELNLKVATIPIPARKWKFDFCILAFKIAIEYEGIIAPKSRHTTIDGFTGDSNKYNRAQELGYDVLRFTALNYRDVLKCVESVYQKRMLEK